MSLRAIRSLTVVLFLFLGVMTVPVQAADDAPSTKGFLFVQVDGLAEPTLRRALDSGAMPFLAGLVDGGTHTLGSWRTTAATSTSVAQAGLLHGDWRGVPGFRWWDREAGTMMDLLDRGQVRRFESSIAGRDDLLADGGASITNMFTGGAPRVVLTASRFDGLLLLSGTVAFTADLSKTARVVAGLADGLAAAVERLGQGRAAPLSADVKRKLPIPLVGPAVEWALADVSVAATIEELDRGTPLIYTTLTTYDEVGHYAGPEHPAAYAALGRIDRALADIATAASRSARPYYLVVLSDHGQTDGQPFATRFGEDLADVVRRSSAPGGDAAAGGPGAGIGEDDRVVAASGNLAHVYLDPAGAPLTREEIERSHPGLLDGLVEHPGIGVVVVRDRDGEAVALGPAGWRELSNGRVEGLDPTSIYGELAAESLANIAAPDDAGDIVVISTYDPVGDRVFSLEGQIGSHGGIGGPQMEPFLLYPNELEPGAVPLRLVGLDALRSTFAGWIGAEAPAAHIGPEVCVTAEVSGASGEACARRDRFGAAWALSVDDTADDGRPVHATVSLEVDDARDPDATLRNDLGEGQTMRTDGSFEPRFGGALGDVSIEVCVDVRFRPDPCQTVSAALPELVGRASPAQAARLETLVFDTTLDEFEALWLRDEHNGLDADFDWSSDGCSFGPLARAIDDRVELACVRHDFGYRNFGRRFLDPRDSVRGRIDDQLIADLRSLGWDQRANGLVATIRRFIAPVFFGDELRDVWQVPQPLASWLMTPELDPERDPG